MTDAEREKVRAAGAQDARRSRLAQGLPERVEDPAAIVILAALLRSTREPTANESNRHERKPAG